MTRRTLIKQTQKGKKTPCTLFDQCSLAFFTYSKTNKLIFFWANFNHTTVCLTEKNGEDRDFFLFSFPDDNTFSLVQRKQISCTDEDIKLGAKLKVKTRTKVYMGYLLNFGK